jgi:hypothetical protein
MEASRIGMSPKNERLLIMASLPWCASAIAVIIAPYWFVLFFMVLVSGATAGFCGIWAGIKDNSISRVRRTSLLLLGCGYIIGAAVFLVRLYVKAELVGWFSRAR